MWSAAEGVHWQFSFVQQVSEEAGLMRTGDSQAYLDLSVAGSDKGIGGEGAPVLSSCPGLLERTQDCPVWRLHPDEERQPLRKSSQVSGKQN